MSRTDGFEWWVLARVTLSRYATRLSVCGLDLRELLRRHQNCALRSLLVSALQTELATRKGLPPRSAIEDVVDEWVLG